MNPVDTRTTDAEAEAENIPYGGPQFGDTETQHVLDGEKNNDLFRSPGRWEMYNATGAESAALMQHLEDIQRCSKEISEEWRKRRDSKNVSPYGAGYGRLDVADCILPMWNPQHWSMIQAVCRYRTWHGKPNIFFIRHKKGKGGILGQAVVKRSWTETPEPFIFNLKPPSSLRDLAPFTRMFTPKKRTPEFIIREEVFGTWIENSYSRVVPFVHPSHVEEPDGSLNALLDCVVGEMPEVPVIDEVVYNKVTRWTREIDNTARFLEHLRKLYKALLISGYSLQSAQNGWSRIEAKRAAKKPLDAQTESLVWVSPASMNFDKNHRNQVMLVVRTASEAIDRTAALLPDSFRYVKPKP